MYKTLSLLSITRALVLSIAIGIGAFCAGTSVNAFDGIAQNYKAPDTVSPGALVSISSRDMASVELATRNNENKLIGVASVSPLIVLNASGPSTTTVVTNGVTDVLVSDYNGRVQVGDKIAVSPIAGIGQRATGSATIIGTARNDISQRGGVTKTITDDNGKQRTVTINLVSIQVNVSAYVVPENYSLVPAPIQDAANKFAGHEVPAIRVFIALGIALLIFIGILVVMYAAVRSSITSIGRNPLAAVSIRRSLLQLCAIIPVVLGVSLTVIYFLLTV